VVFIHCLPSKWPFAPGQANGISGRVPHTGQRLSTLSTLLLPALVRHGMGRPAGHGSSGKDRRLQRMAIMGNRVLRHRGEAMARLPILLLLAALEPALAAQTPPAPTSLTQTALSIDQFEQSSLPVLHTMHDKQAARELAGLKLTERAGPQHAADWQAEMPGKRSSKALTALVDASSFLALPARETPATPAPAIDAQKQMLALAANQVETMLHKLPNFYAARTTMHFETATPAQLVLQEESLTVDAKGDSGLMPPSLGNPRRLPHEELGPVDPAKQELGRLFFITNEVQSVTYANGSEVDSAPRGKSDAWRSADLGLATRGEFGPVLEMVLEDAFQRGLSWSHWEQGANGPLAVFRYSVPKNLSHYQIVSPEGNSSYFPAYHGELAIDPGSGAILRITIQSPAADQAKESLDSNILVEYGPVEIGGRTYICPIHCVAISRTHSSGETENGAAQQPTFLNDETFTGYHLFRAEMRILPSTQ
jgi:hypothetical protein